MFRTPRQRQLDAELELWGLLHDGKLLLPDGTLDREPMLLAVKSVLSTAELAKNGRGGEVHHNHVGFAERHFELYSKATITLADAMRSKTDPKVIYANFIRSFGRFQLPFTQKPWDDEEVDAIKKAA